MGSLPVGAKAPSGGCGCKGVAVPEHGRSVLPNVSLAPQFIANARTVKTPTTMVGTVTSVPHLLRKPKQPRMMLKVTVTVKKSWNFNS